MAPIRYTPFAFFRGGLLSSLRDSECLRVDLVARLVDGGTTPEELASAEAHIGSCADCARLVAEVGRAARSHVHARNDEPEPSVAGRGFSDLGITRYEIDRKVGEGAMGVVYAARDRVLGRQVALKVLHADVDSQELEARLLREATILAGLSHTEIVTVYDAGRESGRLFLALELLEGGTLRDWLVKERRPWREVVAMFSRAGRGLSAAHDAGVIHRDFKPDNVLVGVDGRIRVTDFGLARSDGDVTLRCGVDGGDRSAIDALSVVRSLATRSGTMIGTPGYMSPEQLSGREADARSDIFSFCVALYEGLYGERPFAGSTLAELRKSVMGGVVRSVPPRSPVPSRVRRVVLRGLQANPDTRYPSMQALLDDLARVAAPRRVRAALGAALSVVLIAGASYGAARGRTRGGHIPATGGAAPASCAPLPDGATVYVQASSRREETGTLSCPFHTITAALHAARRTASVAPTVHVGPGRYTAASGEVFPLELRGVSLEGAGADVTTIEGMGETDHREAGGVLNRPGTLIRVTMLVGDEKETTRLSGVTILPGEPQRNENMGIVCDRGAGASDSPSALPNTLVENVVFGPEYSVGAVVTTSTRPSATGCNLRVLTSHFERHVCGVWVVGCGEGEGSVPVAVEIGDGTDAHRNTFRDVQFDGEDDSSGAVSVWDCVSSLRVEGNLFEAERIGLTIVRHPSETLGRVVVARNTFRNLTRAGIIAMRAARIDRLEDNVFRDIDAVRDGDPAGIGLWLRARGERAPPSVVRARRNAFVGNNIGVLLDGTRGAPPSAHDVTFDFGREGDEGDNEFRCNSRTALAPGFDVKLDFPAARSLVSLVGNGWDHFPPEVRSPGTAGDGADIVLSGGGGTGGGRAFDPAQHGGGGRCPPGHGLGPQRR